MRFLDSGKRRKLTINITSLIDVLFLLIIFVLITAQFEDAGGIKVNLPTGKSKELPDRKTLTLVVTKDGKYFLGDKPVPRDQLGETLKAESAKAKETVLVIKGDVDARYEKVIEAVEIARESGLRQVAFRTTAVGQ